MKYHQICMTASNHFDVNTEQKITEQGAHYDLSAKTIVRIQ